MQPPNQAQNNDIYTDPAIVDAKIDDPLALFISKHWQQLIMALVVIGIGYYFYNGYLTSQRENQMRAAELYSKAQNSFEELERLRSEELKANPNNPETSEAKVDSNTADSDKELAEKSKQNQIAEARGRLTQQLAALGDTPAPYKQMGVLYSIRMAIAQNDLKSAESALATLPAWNTVDRTDSALRYIGEQAALLYAIGLIDDDSRIQEGRELLISLGKSGVFVAPQAAITLARIATSKPEKSEALSLLESVSRSLPSQSDLLANEIELLK